MKYTIAAKGNDKRIYHLVSYTEHAGSETVFKWVGDENSPFVCITFEDKDTAEFYLKDKYEDILSAENTMKIIKDTINIAKINIKIGLIKAKKSKS